MITGPDPGTDLGEPLHRRRAHATLDPTRAKPPPWFVGNGRAIMLLVVSACALLMIARGVTMWLMIEEAWTWWTAPFSIDRPLQPAISPPPVEPGSGPRGVRGNPGEAFDPASYPPEALRRGEQGRSVVKLSIDAAGRPVRCVVSRSSGSSRLDEATCRTAMRRAHFDPARDMRGAAIPASYTMTVRWVLPED